MFVYAKCCYFLLCYLFLGSRHLQPPHPLPSPGKVQETRPSACFHSLQATTLSKQPCIKLHVSNVNPDREVFAHLLCPWWARPASPRHSPWTVCTWCLWSRRTPRICTSPWRKAGSRSRCCCGPRCSWSRPRRAWSWCWGESMPEERVKTLVFWFV